MSPSFIPIVRDDRGYAHAPDCGASTHAVCGIDGAYEEMPAGHAAMWCSTCTTDCRNSKGERSWPTIVKEDA